ncbi:unnamed protein product [Cylindrotheca closterium]|uniref:Protein FAM33A n=1 Tax=Cylindrotheca closterium TaxID=2856 RepID=A0AAD2JLQ5_9STRA|nr:unnamed protein product [Cylindrotheca closterium]
MEVEARAWTAQLAKAEADILQASQKLEKEFKERNRNSLQNGGQEIPDPIKLVRRLTALELALENLKNDCEFIATKRTEIVKSVMETQVKNVTQVQEMLGLTDRKTMPFRRSIEEPDEDDGTLADLTQKMTYQCDFLVDANEAC